jgi:hypothetical protein
MGPRSDNRGYGGRHAERRGQENASMGPRSDNRGYDTPYLLNSGRVQDRFNGSTVG